MLPSPRPGARFEVAMPFMLGGWGGRALVEEVGVNRVEFDDPVRDVADISPAVNDEGRGVPISRSGNVMKKRQPKVVPKNAPSTV